MTNIYLGLGSNMERHYHISAGLDALAEFLGAMKLSPVYESKSVGFDGRNFFNMVVSGETTLSIGALSERLKKIEDANGRKRQGPKFSPRTLDIDILLYGDFVGEEDGVLLPRPEIIQNAFVLKPLADLAPQLHHPVFQQDYQTLWHQYDQTSQSLWCIDFEWSGKIISVAQSKEPLKN